MLYNALFSHMVVREGLEVNASAMATTPASPIRLSAGGTCVGGAGREGRGLRAGRCAGSPPA